MSSPHKISLKTNWKVHGRIELDELNRREFVACRSFHRPSGLSNSQVIHFCLEPVVADLHVLINGLSRTLIVIGGLATVPITNMLDSINRVELRWSGDPMATPQLFEHFSAWLEISDDLLNNPLP